MQNKGYIQPLYTRAGFTVIEIIMAMAILAVGVIGVVRLLPVGLRASRSAEMMSKAAFVAQEKLEEIKLSGFEGITEGGAILSGEEGAYVWEADVSNVSLDGLFSSANIRQVNLVVQWQERGNTRSQEFITYIGKK